MATEEQLSEAILSAARTEGDCKTLACARAFQLAEQFGVSVRTVGRICNEKNIRIRQCQLGCFP